MLVPFPMVTGSHTYVPGGKRTWPPLLRAAWMALVSRVTPSPFAPKLRTFESLEADFGSAVAHPKACRQNVSRRIFRTGLRAALTAEECASDTEESKRQSRGLRN